MANTPILLDAPLVPDPDAERELAGSPETLLTDAEIKDCRILVTRRDVTLADFANTPGGMVQLSCTFQPAPGTRFAYGQFFLELLRPEGVRLIDLSPRKIDDPNPVKFTIDRKGSITLKHATFPLEPSIESGTSREYVRYHCTVQGTGVGSEYARWDFRENPDRKDGIGLEQVLSFTVPVQEMLEANVMVSARIVRSGVPGVVDAVRDLILGHGSGLDNHWQLIRIDLSGT